MSFFVLHEMFPTLWMMAEVRPSQLYRSHKVVGSVPDGKDYPKRSTMGFRVRRSQKSKFLRRGVGTHLGQLKSLH
jgi:hypothetical protein